MLKYTVTTLCLLRRWPGDAEAHGDNGVPVCANSVKVELMRRLNKLILCLVSVVWILGMMAGCSDLGSDPVGPPILLPPATAVSFGQDIKPILNRYGCSSCHGGSGGLFVQSVSQIRQGGLHGPAVTPGDAANSILAKKISVTPPFGDRMPQGGPYLPDSVQQVIRLWINQGALDN